MTLHGLKSVDKAGAAVGVDEMVAAMDRRGHGICPARRSNAKGDRQHDSVAVRHHGDAHGFFGVMAVRHRQIIGQGRARQAGTNRANVNDLMRHVQARSAGRRKIQFFAVALAVIE